MKSSYDLRKNAGFGTMQSKSPANLSIAGLICFDIKSGDPAGIYT